VPECTEEKSQSAQRLTGACRKLMLGCGQLHERSFQGLCECFLRLEVWREMLGLEGDAGPGQLWKEKLGLEGDAGSGQL